ncbi:MAG: hypothetical protein ACI4PF_05450 [Christensenellales bacterium]
MGDFLSILLDILAILAIIILGSLVVVIVAELILRLLGGSKKKDDTDDNDRRKVVDDDDIVVYSRADNPNEQSEFTTSSKVETIDGDKIEEIDYDKAVEEQRMLQNKNSGNVNASSRTQSKVQKPVEKEPDNDEVFWDDDSDDEFDKFLDDVIKEAKKDGSSKLKKTVDDVDLNKISEEQNKRLEEERLAEEQAKRDAELRKVQEDAKKAIDEATQKELEELRALKEQQQKELEEFKQMKEDFAREKEEQLEILKDNLTKTKEEELERIRLEAIKEQEKLERMQDELAEERKLLESEKIALEEAKNQAEDTKNDEPEQIVKETIIKDEEELNRLKYKNLMRMNARLTRIIRDTEKLQAEKKREKTRLEEERKKLLRQQEEERKKEYEKQVEIEKQEREKILRKQAEEEKRLEIARKLEEAGKKAGKYKLDSKVVRISKGKPADEQVTEVIEEQVVTTTETIPHTNTKITTVEKVPLKASAKPLFAKEYYEDKLQELEEELRDAEKELRINKSEYLPLTRIHKAYVRDSEKLRKKEMQVAKQKVALYGVNSRNVDPAKKEKLDENLQALAELKDSVQHCEEIIKKNKDRYPVIEKNNMLINKQIQRINDDIAVCEKALEYYRKNK